MLEKKSVVDKIEIVNADTVPMIQVRTATWIEEDGVMVGSKGYHRHVVAPDSSLEGEDAQVSAMATTLFTDAVKADYEALKASQEV